MSLQSPVSELQTFIQYAVERLDPAHNYDHACKVLANARIIVSLLGITMTPDEEMLFEFVMMGHDIRDHKLKHLCLSLEEVRLFYVKHLGEEWADLVILMHDNCSWSRREMSVSCGKYDWMRKVLQDADWLEAVGEIAIERTIEYTRYHTPDVDVPAQVCMLIRTKYLLIPGELNFDCSRDLAARHIEPMLQYLRNNGQM
jgi:hypothetical protein